MKVLKVKRNNTKELADEGVLGYTQFSKKEELYHVDSLERRITLATLYAV